MTTNQVLGNVDLILKNFTLKYMRMCQASLSFLPQTLNLQVQELIKYSKQHLNQTQTFIQKIHDEVLPFTCESYWALKLM